MGPQFSSAINSGILLTLFTGKMIYYSGEPVEITLVKVNYSARPVSLFYPTSQRFDFSITQNGKELWRWSHDQFFLQIVQPIVLKPLESQVYQVTWLQNTSLQSSVPPGTYQLSAINVAKELRTSPVQLTLRIK